VSSNLDPRNLTEIIDNLMDSYADKPFLTNLQGLSLPSRECVRMLIGQLENLLYPGLVECISVDFAGLRYVIGNRVVDAFEQLKETVLTCLNYASNIPEPRFEMPASNASFEEQAHEIVLSLFKKLPEIREMLHDDLLAAYHGDPAAKCYAEIICSYPSVRTLGIHRIAHELEKAQVPILPRMLSEYMHSRTGIDIHPGATIGRGFFIDHGTGVVIGETSIIGNNVKIYQGVTLGALSIPDPNKVIEKKRHPTIEDDVTIYAGATILGGRTVVGARSVVGANVWLTHSIEPDTKVLFNPPELRIKNPNQDPWFCML